MTERQPDMLGGKAVPASGLRRMRTRAKAPVRREGWAGTPGNGPAGETCGSCTYCALFHYRKSYHKCSARPGDHWKGGRATDIRPLDPACEKWAPTTERVNIEKAKADAANSIPHDRARSSPPVEGGKVAGGSPLRERRASRGAPDPATQQGGRRPAAARIDPLQLTLDV